jgi:hypothetical protein
MIKKQLGISLSGAIVWMVILALGGLFAAKLMPSYLEYFAVKKIMAAMQESGETKGTVRDIRVAFDRRNTIEGVQAMRGEDLEITKENERVVIKFGYDKEIELIAPVYLVIKYRGRSQ